MNEYPWRNTMLRIRLGPFDGWAIVPILMFVFHWAFWTLGVMVLSLVVFYLLERANLSLTTGLRAIRCWLLPPIRPAVLAARPHSAPLMTATSPKLDTSVTIRTVADPVELTIPSAAAALQADTTAARRRTYDAAITAALQSDPDPGMRSGIRFTTTGVSHG